MSRIQKYLVEEFQSERIRVCKKTTKWDIQAGEKLRLILADCEEHMQRARRGGTTSTLRGEEKKNVQEDICLDKIRDHMDDIANGENTRRYWGYPINSTFISLEDLWQQMRNTRMHAVDRQDVEFALAVRVVAYPSNIMSVWIYIAAFVDKTRTVNN